MEPSFINTYELGQILDEDDSQKWCALYGPLNQGIGCDSCARDLIENRSVRMVVKLKNRFWAVDGHISVEPKVEGREAVEFPPGMYVSASDDSDEITYHSHLLSHDNRPITLVDVKQVATFDDKNLEEEVRKSPWMESFCKEKITEYRHVAKSIRAFRVVDGWKRLYRDDTLKLLVGVKKAASPSVQGNSPDVPEQPEEHCVELDQECLDAMRFVEHIQAGRLGVIYCEEVKKYCSGEQEWNGQQICKRRLVNYNVTLDEPLTNNEIETLTKMLIDLFSTRRK